MICKEDDAYSRILSRFGAAAGAIFMLYKEHRQTIIGKKEGEEFRASPRMSVLFSC